MLPWCDRCNDSASTKEHLLIQNHLDLDINVAKIQQSPLVCLRLYHNQHACEIEKRDEFLGVCTRCNKPRPPRWSIGRRSRLLTWEVGWFKPRVDTSCHRLATDTILHCVPWSKLRRWDPPTRYTSTCTTSIIMKIWFFDLKKAYELFWHLQTIFVLKCVSICFLMCV